ncbi:MAG: hypothetical protein SF052_27745 [Bacteroidia bacterium]|nr:hypothetical protein [Bacteroidia bacterium]
MTRKLRRFFPAFLKTFDKYLLLHFPEIWATRLHFLAWGLLMIIPLCLGMAWLQVDIRNLSYVNTHFGMMFIPVVMIFLIWVYHLGKYNPEREFGHTSLQKRLSVQAMVGLGIVMLMFIPYLYGFSVSYFNASRINDRELISDINKVNLISTNLGKSKAENLRDRDRYAENFTIIHGPTHLEGVVLGASLYFDWEKRSREEKLKMIAEYLRIVEKYDGWQSIRVYEPAQILDGEVQNPENLEQALRASFDNIQWPLRDIVEAKERHHSWNHDFMHASAVSLIIFSIFLTWGLVMIYLKMGWAKFVVGVIVGVGVFILSSFVVISGGDTDFAVTLFMGLWAFFILQAYFRPKSHRANYWKILILALGAAMTPVVPFIIKIGFDIFFEEPLALLYMSLSSGVLTFFLWNLIFADRFQKLTSLPVQG